MTSIQAFDMLDVEIHPMSINDLNHFIHTRLQQEDRCIILSQNLHSIYTLHHNKEMKMLHQLPETYKRVDGMPVIWMAKGLGYPINSMHRVTWVDWMHPLMREAANKDWKLFYLGSRPGVAEKGANFFIEQYSNLKIKTKHGYFNSDNNTVENQLVIDEINSYQPDILIVGMGMPRQEKWIFENYLDLKATVIMTSGAAMDYFAGLVSIPPRWMGRAGTEWLFRLAENPTRLWRRYLLEPWFVIHLYIKDLLKFSEREF